jgi:hypothetical protein
MIFRGVLRRRERRHRCWGICHCIIIKHNEIVVVKHNEIVVVFLVDEVTQELVDDRSPARLRQLCPGARRNEKMGRILPLIIIRNPHEGDKETGQCC